MLTIRSRLAPVRTALPLSPAGRVVRSSSDCAEWRHDSLLARATAATPAELQRLVTATFRHTLYLTVLAVIAFEALAGFLIPMLYGQNFREAVLPARVLAPAMVAMGALSVIFNSIASVGANRILFIAPAIALVTNNPLTLLSIQSMIAVLCCSQPPSNYQMLPEFITL